MSQSPKHTFKSSLVEKQKRCLSIVKKLKQLYPNAKCSLDYKTDYQLLIATMLSAQCTDARVNQVTPALFKKYPDAISMAKAPISDIENLVRSTGFYRNKAKNIKSCSQDLVDKWQNKLPQNVEDLSSLAGVGRKTANVVLGCFYAVPSMVVDTHVTRISNRLKLAKGENAVKLELDLQKVVEQKDWVIFTHLLIDHGRAICTARSPKCQDCKIASLCPQNLNY